MGNLAGALPHSPERLLGATRGHCPLLIDVRKESVARRALPRGAVVFAVGALDAYLSDVSADVIVTGLRSEPGRSDLREVLRQVQKEVPTLSLEVALLPLETDRVSHIQNAVLERSHQRTLPSR